MSIFDPLLCPSLKQLLTNVDIPPLARVSQPRLSNTALLNLGQIELVTSTDFSKDYDSIYISMFPKRTEREGSNLITVRLAAQAAGKRYGLAPYRIVGLRDRNSEVIGAAQFSVLMLAGGEHAVPYLQYLYVREQNRRQDMAEVLHTFVLAVAEADANANVDLILDGVRSKRRTVPFTLFETEPPGHGDDDASRAYAHQRAQIHTKAGGVALVLRRDIDGKIISPHVQPGLEIGDGPLSLVWMIRPSPAVKLTTQTQEGERALSSDLKNRSEDGTGNGKDAYDIATLGSVLIKGYYQSLRDEGFPEENIRIAERIVEERCKGSVFSLMPLGDYVPYSGP